MNTVHKEELQRISNTKQRRRLIREKLADDATAIRAVREYKEVNDGLHTI